jgi:cytochrome c oxidase subunit 1
MVGGTLLAYLGGLHYWWPKIIGRMYPEGWGRFSALVVFVGFNLTFAPQFVLGYMGMPRRYHTYPAEWFRGRCCTSCRRRALRSSASAADSVDLSGWSLRYGRIAEANPWHLPGLEWQTPSPPPTENFYETPIVTSEPYEFAPPETKEVVGKFEKQAPAQA